MPCPCAAKMDNAEKQGCTHILRKSIYIFFILFSSWNYSCGNVTNVTPWLVPLKQIGLVDDVPLRNNF